VPFVTGSALSGVLGRKTLENMLRGHDDGDVLQRQFFLFDVPGLTNRVLLWGQNSVHANSLHKIRASYETGTQCRSVCTSLRYNIVLACVLSLAYTRRGLSLIHFSSVSTLSLSPCAVCLLRSKWFCIRYDNWITILWYAHTPQFQAI